MFALDNKLDINKTIFSGCKGRQFFIITTIF